MPRRIDQHPYISRAVPIDDLQVDGRTVTAYAATFGDPYPVADFQGRYHEIINRNAFNRHLGQHGTGSVKVMVNHGMTPFMTPSERFSLPVGTPIDIKPDGRGLLTVTRYANTDLADEILQLIRDGAITTQSFRGPVFRTAPERRESGNRVLERLELGLTEYGPVAMTPANPEAKIVALRAALTADDLDSLTEEEREQLRRLLEGSTPIDDPVVDDGPPPETPDTPDTTEEEVPVSDPSNELEIAAAKAAALRLREETP